VNWVWWLDILAALVILLGVPPLVYMHYKMRKWLKEGRRR
jgi:uncharacterized membrane protein YesL